MGEGGALSLFRFHLSPFPPETPDTQAICKATKMYVKHKDKKNPIQWSGTSGFSCCSRIQASHPLTKLLTETNKKWPEASKL